MVHSDHLESTARIDALTSDLRAIKANYNDSKNKPTRDKRYYHEKQTMPHYQRIEFGQAKTSLAKIKTSYTRSIEECERKRNLLMSLHRKFESGHRSALPQPTLDRNSDPLQTFKSAQARSLTVSSAALCRLNHDRIQIQERYSRQKAPVHSNPDRVPCKSVEQLSKFKDDAVPCDSCPTGGVRIASKFLKGSIFAIHDDNCTMVDIQRDNALMQMGRGIRPVKFTKSISHITPALTHRDRMPDVYSSKDAARLEAPVFTGVDDEWKGIFMSACDKERSNDEAHQSTIQYIRKHRELVTSRIIKLAHQPIPDTSRF